MPGGAFLPDLSRLGHAQLDVATPLTGDQREELNVLLAGLTADELEQEAKELLSRAKKAQSKERKEEREEAAKQRKTAEAEAASVIDADRAKMSDRKDEQAAFFSVILELETMAENIVQSNASGPLEGVTQMQVLFINQMRNNVFYIKRLIKKDGSMNPTKTFTGFAISIIKAMNYITQDGDIQQNTLESANAILAMVQFMADRYTPALLAFFPMIGDDLLNWPQFAAYLQNPSESWIRLLMRSQSGLERMQERVRSLQSSEDPAPSEAGMAPMVE
jgi:hypothetical protein